MKQEINEDTSGGELIQFHCKVKVPIAGYIIGMHQSSVIAKITVSGPIFSDKDILNFSSAITCILEQPSADRIPPNFQSQPAPYLIILTVSALLSRARFPVFTKGLLTTQENERSFHLTLPAIDNGYAATNSVLDWVIGMANDALSEKPMTHWKDDLPKLIKRISRHAPKGFNTIRFLKAAHDANIPWRHVHSNVFQFGWGSKGRLLDSSFTDCTPQISATLARNKLASANVLRNAGIPVPKHLVARNEAQALSIAEMLGYPVVIKPADLDGGIGVMAGLKNQMSVKTAYAKAAALSKKILVEEHIEARDYRLQVFHDEVFWIVERIPGGVVGDGFNTITQLLDNLNAERKPDGKDSTLKRINIDDEALELLSEYELNSDSTPEKGHFVRLRRSANVSNGGIPIPSLEKAHPDNIALAVRAARILRLDVAGIDLLITDIAIPWHQCRAAICEVNAQPQLNPQLPSYLLQRLVKDQGRIPIVIVIDIFDDNQLIESLRSMMSEDGSVAGVATSGGVWIGKDLVSKGPIDTYRGGIALVTDPKIDIGLIVINNEQQSIGLPVDRFDVLILAGFPSENDPKFISWRHMTKLLATTCRLMLINGDCDGCNEVARHLNEVATLVIPKIDMPQALRKHLRDI